MKRLTHIIGVDPSGAFYEGNGTTGIVLWNCVDKCMQKHRTIKADQYESDVDYWQAHLDVIKSWRDAHKYTAVVIEDYLLYAHKAQQQANSRMETCQLIGLLKWYLHTNNIPYRMQPASAVKIRWANDILVYKKYWNPNIRLTAHEVDALRHAVHAAEFYNKGDNELWLGRMMTPDSKSYAPTPQHCQTKNLQ